MIHSRFYITPVLVLLFSTLSAQYEYLDTLDYSNKDEFERKITYRENGNLKQVDYKALTGNLKRTVYYNSKNQMTKLKYLEDKLVREIKYSYHERGQVIKRYDVLNKKYLYPFLNVQFKYPVRSIDEGTQGVVLVDITFTEDCIINDFKILNSLDPWIDKEVDIKIRMMTRLSKEYGAIIRNCQKIEMPWKITFDLSDY